MRRRLLLLVHTALLNARVIPNGTHVAKTRRRERRGDRNLSPSEGGRGRRRRRRRGRGRGRGRDER
jgi:hypothetical protein